MTAKSNLAFVKSVTFIELLIVITIIGILTSISVPRVKKTFDSLRLNSFSKEFMVFMGYLQGRSVVKQKIIFMNVDNLKHEYWAQEQDSPSRLRTVSIPSGINIKVAKAGIEQDPNVNQIIFYPDGDIDKVNIGISGANNQNISLTTEGIFGKVKIKNEQ